MLKKVAKVEVCGICREALMDARVLLCGHKCCEKCAEQQCAMRVVEIMARCGQFTDDVERIEVVCPVCARRSPLDTLVPDDGRCVAACGRTRVSGEQQDRLDVLGRILDTMAETASAYCSKDRDRTPYFEELAGFVKRECDNVRRIVSDTEKTFLDQIAKARKEDEELQKKVSSALSVVLEDIQKRKERLARADLCDCFEDVERFVAEMESFVGRNIRTAELLDSQKTVIDIAVPHKFSQDTFIWMRSRFDCDSPGIVWNPSPHRCPAQVTQIPTGFKSLDGPSAIYDHVRSCIYEISRNRRYGRDIFVTSLEGDDIGATKRFKEIVPFPVSQPPVYDGRKYIYFVQDNSTLVGRVDCDTMTFSPITRPPHSFCDKKRGFFVNGYVYMFCHGRNMKFNTVTGEWSEWVFPSKEYHRIVPHPWNPSLVICITDNGLVSVCDIEGGAVRMKYDSYTDGGSDPEVIPLRAPNGEFVLLVCFEYGSRPWCVFNSARNRWSNTPWPRAPPRNCAATFDEVNMTMFYHLSGWSNWHAVKLK